MLRTLGGGGFGATVEVSYDSAGRDLVLTPLAGIAGFRDRVLESNHAPLAPLGHEQHVIDGDRMIAIVALRSSGIHRARDRLVADALVSSGAAHGTKAIIRDLPVIPRIPGRDGSGKWCASRGKASDATAGGGRS